MRILETPWLGMLLNLVLHSFAKPERDRYRRREGYAVTEVRIHNEDPLDFVWNRSFDKPRSFATI